MGLTKKPKIRRTWQINPKTKVQNKKPSQKKFDWEKLCSEQEDWY
jgi:hypothetical protein